MEGTRAMIHDQGLPKFLWGEVANIVVYVRNRSPHEVMDLNMPKYFFTGKKPDVSNFRMFFYPTYFHVPKEKRNKLEAYGKKGIFVG